MTKEEAIICLKGIKNYGRDTFNEQSDWQDCLDMAIQALEQEPKRGHWIIHGKLRECSECKVWFPKDMPRNTYCPNCGAVMRGDPNCIGCQHYEIQKDICKLAYTGTWHEVNCDKRKFRDIDYGYSGGV